VDSLPPPSLSSRLQPGRVDGGRRRAENGESPRDARACRSGSASLGCVLHSRAFQVARRSGGEARKLVILHVDVVATDENAGPTALKRFICQY
jgi:hypothetical protein